MKTILFFDFESDGLPKFSLPSSDPSQPHATQIAAELCIEETGEALASINFLIRPDGWTIPDNIQELTGITMERANTFGVPAHHAITSLIELWKNADMRCGHNETFDMRICRIEIMRHHELSGLTIETCAEPSISFADYWKRGAAFCTMTSSTSIVNLPPTEKMVKAKRMGPKPPNLAEAYKYFTGQDLEGAHNAQVDIMACKAVYYAIKKHHADLAAIAA